MICFRCGAACDDSDRFCHACGKKITRSSLSHTPGKNPDSATLSARKKWAVFLCVGLILLSSALALIFMPVFKQSFMSPAAYYLESEAKEFSKLTSHISALSTPLFNKSAKQISATISPEIDVPALGKDAEFLNRLNVQALYTTDAKGRTSLSLNTSYEKEIFCTFVANLVGDRIALSFPDMTEGQVVAKVSSVLQSCTSGFDASLKSLTGYDREKLTDWLTSYLQPVLLETLETSEQTLDFAVIDGNEVSTVTFALSDDMVKDLLKELAVTVRRDEMLPAVLKNAADFVTTSAEFRNELAQEFNLSEEDLAQIPLLGEISALTPDFEMPPESSLLYLVNSVPESTDISAYTEALADSISDFANSFSTNGGIALTAYYQGTDLIGRTLSRGTQTLFECFRYRRDGETIFTLRFESGHSIYHFTHLDSSDNHEEEHKLSLTRRPADAEQTEVAMEETLFVLSANYKKNVNVGGVRTLIGEVTLTHRNTTFTLKNELLSSNQTRLLYTQSTTSETEQEPENRLKLRALLKYSSSPQTSGIAIEGSSDFGKPAFSALVLSLQRNLQDSDLFERIFGEGSLSKFLAEEELRQQAAKEDAESSASIPDDQGLTLPDDSKGALSEKGENTANKLYNS